MSVFSAVQLLSSETGATTIAELDDSRLPAGDVVIDVEYSDLNYKDGLTMSPGSILPKYVPLVPGIDFAGVVRESGHPRWNRGDRVVLNGFGIGTDRDGGLTQRTRVPGDWLLPVPRRFSTQVAAAIGTAGYTAALSVDAIRRMGVTPESGPVLVTGASGGVGSVAINLLSALGYDAVASTRHVEDEGASLRELGAVDIVEPPLPSGGGLAPGKWAAAIDNVGSDVFSGIMEQLRYGGVAAVVGVARGREFSSTAFPFILRGTSIVGIESVYASSRDRSAAWWLLDEALDLDRLDAVTQTIGLAEAPSASQRILAGEVNGRLVVDVNS
jgi:acrylyl-CoA reductase (NADPH)